MLLVNATARSGERIDFRELVRALKARHVELTHALRVTNSQMLPRYMRAAIDGGARRVIIGGGDGTVSCAVDVIVRSGADVALGVLPLGTGNDFARAIGLPLKLDEALDALAHASTQQVDVGKVNERFFINAASVGLTTQIAQSLTPRRKRLLGPLAYPVTALQQSLRQKGFVVRLRQPDESPMELGVVQLVIGNGPFHGGGRRVSPEASLEDGLLDVYAIIAAKWRFSAQRAWSLLRVGARMNKGKHVDGSDVLQLRTTELMVETIPEQQVNVDGELIEADRLHFEVMPKALTVLVPRELH